MIIQALSDYIGIPTSLILEIGKKAPLLYRRYSVPKKNGGQRHIYHPAKETKTLQIAAVDLLDSPNLIHDCVRGYVRGLKSPLLSNAIAHKEKSFLLRLDVANFFPSIKPDDFIVVCGNRLCLNGIALKDGDLQFLCSLFFVWNRTLEWFLGIGAPSSPFVSNWVMFEIDKKITYICEEVGITYTRYADDLYFSSNNKELLIEIENSIEDILKNESHPRITLNTNKRYLGSRWSRRRVTGLTITPAGDVKVPRSMKRLIRSKLFDFKRDVLSVQDKLSLSGYLAFLNDCEPSYLNNLVLKFGADLVQEALRKKKLKLAKD